MDEGCPNADEKMRSVNEVETEELGYHIGLRNEKRGIQDDSLFGSLCYWQ